MSRDVQADLVWRLLAASGDASASQLKARGAAEGIDLASMPLESAAVVSVEVGGDGGQDESKGEAKQTGAGDGAPGVQLPTMNYEAVLARGGLLTFASVHARLWRHERALELYFSLLSAIPSAIDSVAAYLSAVGQDGAGGVHSNGSVPRAMELDSCCHAAVLHLVIRQLEPSRLNWMSVDEYVLWRSQVEKVKPIITSLLDLCDARGSGLTSCSPPEYSARTEQLKYGVRNEWERIIFFYVFMRDVASPAAVPPTIVKALLAELESVPLRSLAAFQNLVIGMSSMNLKVLRPSLPLAFL
jgi:hypothetical protein